MNIQGREINKNNPPFIIAEIGINHEGSFEKAKKMIKDAYESGAECVKFQCHIVEDEMVKNDIVPINAKKSIWDIMKKSSFKEKEERELKSYTESLGMIYLSTPFSRNAADRLERMRVSAYKIGSGECNNYPLVEHIASFGKPIILSTGMNDLKSITKSVKILKKSGVEHALLHCTSMYPTPYEKVRLGAIKDLQNNFPNTPVGLSDHSLGNYTSFAGVALGCSIIEKHFVSNKNWRGPDVPISINKNELKDLIEGCDSIFKALQGKKEVLEEEKQTANFAYASVVSIKDIQKGDKFTKNNTWVKRPGNGEIKAEDYYNILGRRARNKIKKDSQLKWGEVEQ